MKPLLLPLAAVLLVSGCVIPGTDVYIPLPWDSVQSLENDVLVVKDLRAIPSTVTPPQQIRLVASIENRGSSEFPLSDDRGSAVSVNGKQKIEVDLFDYCRGLFEVSVAECPGSEDNTACTLDSLLPREIKEVSWILEPSEKTALLTTCDLKISVTYPYTTSGLTTVHFMNSEEYTRQLSQGVFRERTSSTSLGSGPVKAWYEIRDQQPVVAAKSGVTTGIIPVTLVVENRGLGSVEASAGGEPQVLLSDTEHDIFDSPFQTQEQQGCHFQTGKPIKLIQNKREIPCWIAQLSDRDVPKETTNQLTARIEYLYEFRKETTVTVEPKTRA